VFERARLKPGESLLVHGGSSGIGTTAIQIASRLDARVITTAGSEQKCKVCLELGAERAVNYRDEDFVNAAKDFTGGVGVDVVLDMVSGEYIQRNIKALSPDGRHVSIAFLGGSKTEVNFTPVMLKRLTLTGSTLRPLPIERKGEIAKALKETVWPLIAKGEIAPVVHQTFSLAQASEAHRLMESSQHIGKIILVP
jgi:NADPH:quinone reductase-like Zn-dependent oxidoreductase